MPGIKYIAAGFVNDAEKLLTEFVGANSVEFKVFAHFWKKHNFAGVFLGRSSHELPQFTHEIFQLTLNFFSTAELYHEIGAVYLLYALFRNQIVEPPTRVRVVREQYEHFLELRKIAVKERYISLHYVIGYLMEHGFDFVAHPTLAGPRNAKHNMETEKKALQMACMLKDLKDHSLSLFESNSLQEIQKLNKDYTELTRNIPFKNDVFEDDDFNMEAQLKNLSMLVGADSNDSETSGQKEKAYENIGDRRARIKSNAFAAKAWFRQLNPTDEDDDEDDLEKLTRSIAQRKSLSRKGKESQQYKEDEESDGKEGKPKKRVRRRTRVPKGQRKIGRPRKDQALVQMLMETDDAADENPLKGVKKRGPVARSSYLDRYIEQPFKEPNSEMTILSSTSEEEENIDEPEEVEIPDEKDVKPDKEEIPDEKSVKSEELAGIDEDLVIEF